jgi:hypothetical protein
MGVYEGSCHCGTVRFRATLALEGVMECNCSIDARVGGLLAPVAAEQFELLAGADELGDYSVRQEAHPSDVLPDLRESTRSRAGRAAAESPWSCSTRAAWRASSSAI